MIIKNYGSLKGELTVNVRMSIPGEVYSLFLSTKSSSEEQS